MAHTISTARHIAKSGFGIRRAADQAWRRIARELFDPYRPERHYMRGPGPKWRAKHPHVAAMSQPTA